MLWMKCDAKKSIRAAAVAVAVCVIMTAVFAFRVENPGGLENVKPVFQADYKDTIVTLNGEKKSVWTSGCGAVAVGMAAGYMTGGSVSCERLFKWACDNGYYSGNGLDHDALSAMLRTFGLNGRWVDNDNLNAVQNALTAGYPVVAHVGPGTFTQNGHYILLIGYKDGQALVNDPGSRNRSGQYFDMALIQKELRREKSFMIVERV